jgi:hypothetical protein
MAEDAPSAAYAKYIEASQRFDYFVTGAAGAVLSYAVQSYSPVSGDAAPWLPPVAWLCLLGSAGSGLVHLHNAVKMLRISAAKVSVEGDVQILREAGWKGQGAFLHGLNIAIAPTQVPHAVSIHDAHISADREMLNRVGKKGKIAANIRNGLLFCGLAILTVWKILSLAGWRG